MSEEENAVPRALTTPPTPDRIGKDAVRDALLDLPFANTAPIEWDHFEWLSAARALSATPAQPVDETARLRDMQGKCSCAEVRGENPACPRHGLGTKWALENPEPGSEGLPDRLIAYADNVIANRAMGMAAMADDLRQAANEIECLHAALQHKGEVSRG